MNKRLTFFVVVSGLLAGCATPYQPMVDTRGVDMRYHDRDLQECKQYAARIDPGASVAASGVGGAIIGGILGSILGGNSRDAGSGALAGAVIGGVAGQAASNKAQSDIIRNCMAERGYRVLN